MTHVIKLKGNRTWCAAEQRVCIPEAYPWILSSRCLKDHTKDHGDANIQIRARRDQAVTCKRCLQVMEEDVVHLALIRLGSRKRITGCTTPGRETSNFRHIRCRQCAEWLADYAVNLCAKLDAEASREAYGVATIRKREAP